MFEEVVVLMPVELSEMAAKLRAALAPRKAAAAAKRRGGGNGGGIINRDSTNNRDCTNNRDSTNNRTNRRHDRNNPTNLSPAELSRQQIRLEQLELDRTRREVLLTSTNDPGFFPSLPQTEESGEVRNIVGRGNLSFFT